LNGHRHRIAPPPPDGIHVGRRAVEIRDDRHECEKQDATFGGPVIPDAAAETPETNRWRQIIGESIVANLKAAMKSAPTMTTRLAGQLLGHAAQI
jgi:hypothetical protein